MIKYTYTILYVQDVTKSITFYENAFGFIRKFITPENDYGELAVGEITISFASHELASTNLSKGYLPSSLNNKPFGIELGFVTLDVQQTINNAINAGAVLEEEAKTKPWGQIVGYIRDIDGFLIEICTPVNAN
jgi:lactoylglutathione lyase